MRTAPLERRARLLSYFTVIYNILEGLVSVIAGIISGSPALQGFGFDSFIESLSGGIMIWRFRQRDGVSEIEMERIEKHAIHLVAYAFFVLGAYVLYESLTKLVAHEAPEPGLIGIAIAIISLIVMPVLYLAKKKTGEKLSSRSLVADSKQTLMCMFLSLALLAGQTLHYWAGLWWADPAAGVLIALLIFREAYKTYQEGALCAC